MNEIETLKDKVTYLETQVAILVSSANTLINRELDRIIASGDAEKVKKYVT